MKKLLVTVSAAVAVGLPALAGAADAGAARAAVSKMEEASVQVINLVNAAKAQNDALKFSCLNDKATQIKTYVAGANGTLGKATKLDAAAQQEAFQGVLADADAVEKLRVAATECVGVAEAEEAKAQQKKQTAAAEQFDALDSRESASSRARGAIPATPATPAIRSPGAAVPATPASPFRN